MKILLIGYGKMGKAIEAVALQRGHQIVDKIDIDTIQKLTAYTSNHVDVAIEFTHPTSAKSNLLYCLDHNIPVVCGTTGWLSAYDQVVAHCKSKNGTFCYSSNYSIGVNIFFKINALLAQYMHPHSQYDVTMEETHHVYKKDAPSGTAISIAEGILRHLKRKTTWTSEIEKTNPETLYIEHKRVHNEPGIHEVQYRSGVDQITINHTAFSREGFATGAVVAAEFIIGKKGIFDMQAVLGIENA